MDLAAIIISGLSFFVACASAGFTWGLWRQSRRAASASERAAESAEASVRHDVRVKISSSFPRDEKVSKDDPIVTVRVTNAGLRPVRIESLHIRYADRTSIDLQGADLPRRLAESETKVLMLNAELFSGGRQVIAVWAKDSIGNEWHAPKKEVEFASKTALAVLRVTGN